MPEVRDEAAAEDISKHKGEAEMTEPVFARVEQGFDGSAQRVPTATPPSARTRWLPMGTTLKRAQYGLSAGFSRVSMGSRGVAARSVCLGQYRQSAYSSRIRMISREPMLSSGRTPSASII